MVAMSRCAPPNTVPRIRAAPRPPSQPGPGARRAIEGCQHTSSKAGQIGIDRLSGKVTGVSSLWDRPLNLSVCFLAGGYRTHTEHNVIVDQGRPQRASTAV